MQRTSCRDMQSSSGSQQSPNSAVLTFQFSSVQFSSVAQSCPTLCNPMDHSTPSFSVLHHLPEFAHTQPIELVIPFNHLILYCPLLLLPSVFPSIRVFSNESARHIRWPKYWSFSFSISSSDEYSGLIFFRIDCLDLLAVALARALWDHL